MESHFNSCIDIYLQAERIIHKYACARKYIFCQQIFPQCLSFGLCFLWFGIVWCWRSISCFRLLASLPYMSILAGLVFLNANCSHYSCETPVVFMNGEIFAVHEIRLHILLLNVQLFIYQKNMINNKKSKKTFANIGKRV